MGELKIISSPIEQALVSQNTHWDNIPYKRHIPREHDLAAINDLSLTEIQIITGIRRCGKSTLLETLINHLMSNNSAKSLLYVNFDDPYYTQTYSDATQLHTIITLAEKLTGEKVQYLFLDEVQNVEAWEKYVKSVYDSHIFKKIIITGSNTDLLKSDYINLLSGRYIETHVYPLCFSEILRHNGIQTRYDLIKQKPVVLAQLDKMLFYGGFPRVHCIDDVANINKILKNYYETILLKDCIKNHDIRDAKVFLQFAHYLISNVSALYSYNSIAKALSMHENTVIQFLHILESAYFLHEIKIFSYSLKAQSRAKKKPYCIDNGLITGVAFQFSQNLGKLLENLVYSELIKRNKGKIYFYNDQKECDFIVQAEKLLALQVCYELNPNNRAREINGLNAAMQALSIEHGYIITYDQEEVISDSISAVPFWRFFAEM